MCGRVKMYNRSRVGVADHALKGVTCTHSKKHPFANTNRCLFPSHTRLPPTHHFLCFGQRMHLVSQ